MIKTVIKSDGRAEPFDIEKLRKWGEWANVVGLNYQEIVLRTFKKLSNETISSNELHDLFIQTCLEEDDEAHSRIAGRLYLGTIYKRCYGHHDNIPKLSEFYDNMVRLGYWEYMGYNSDELDYIENNIINHDIDKTYTYSQLKQIADKYSIRDKVVGTYYESPQFTFIRMAMALSKDELDGIKKLKFVNDYYTELAIKQTINAPTPNYVNLGTQNQGYASCCLVAQKDTAKSIATGHYIADQMTCASAGIGTHLKTRSKGDKVKGGTIKHTGKLPYYRALQASVKANVQSSRGGGATTYITCNDPEIYDLIKARSVTTPQEKRVGGIDYAFSHCKEFRKRVANNENWPLFSYGDYPDLYEAMYNPDELIFENKLKECESKPNTFTYVNARDIMVAHLKEEFETGRAYEFNMSEANRHTSFKETIWQSNLCNEIYQPTTGYDNVDQLFVEEESGEISLCTLFAVIVSHLKLELNPDNKGFTKESVDEYMHVAYLGARMVDTIVDMMDYPFPQLAYTSKNRRNMAAGISGLAELMAKNKLRYSSMEGKRFIHMLSELHSYAVHSASLRLAKERGVCGWSHKTKYPDGWLPIDTYNKNVDTVVDNTLYLDWETLRSEIIAIGGLRTSSCIGVMPCESSSLNSFSTNSVYPIRDKVIIKGDASKGIKFIAPNLERYGNYYEIAWDIPTKDMLECYAIIQKFTDQGISIDTWEDKNDSGKFSADKALNNFLYGSWLGLKGKYYTNSRNNGKMIDFEDNSCGEGVCKM